MSDLPENQSFWLSRVFSGIFKGYGKKEDKPTEANHGANWNNPYGVDPTYSQQQALSAYGGHGYTYAAVSRSSADLAALPLILTSGKGKNAKVIDDSPVLDLFDEPSTDMDGYLFREQLRTDLMLSGNCYILLLGISDQPDSIIRLHPAEVEIVTDERSGITGYRHESNGQVVIYPPERVLHGRNPTYAKGPKSLYGVGVVEPLTREINADINAQKLASQSSAKGRPDILIHPLDPADVWGLERRREILDQYRGLASEGGAMVLSGQVGIEPLKLTPREMEFEASRRMARESISAVCGVPPVVLGLPSANFATARQQNITYWTNQQKASKRLDHLFTKIAKLFNPDYQIKHDFTSVEALQSVRDAQLLRIQQHIANGIPPAEAYNYEGLGDAFSANEVLNAEVEDEADTRSLALFIAKAEKKTDFPSKGEDKKVSLRNSQYRTFDVDFAFMIKEGYPTIWKKGGNIEGNNQFRRLYPIAQRSDKTPQTETEDMAIRKREAWSARHYEDFRIAGVIAQIKWLTVGSRGEKYMKDLVREEIKKIESKGFDEKKKVWNTWIEREHSPIEKKLEIAARAYLSAASKRYARRFKSVLSQKHFQNGTVTKSITDWSELFDEQEEEKKIKAEVGSVWMRGFMNAGAKELTRLFTASKIPQAAITFSDFSIPGAMISKMASEIIQTTTEKIRKVVEFGLLEGSTESEIARSITSSKAFDASRATLIARTEATRSLNAANVQAARIAVGEGLGIQKQWVTENDDKVREEHVLLNGQTVMPDELFEVDGMTAPGPGQFGEASMDCNCRCMVLNVVIK